MSLLSVFIAWPWLALVPAGVFWLLYGLDRRRLGAAAALAWCLYAVYEYSMRRRWLCTGECNIRVDLLLLYPALVFLSAAALLASFRSFLARRRVRS